MREYHSILRQGVVDCLIVGSALMVITGLGGIVAHTLLGGLAHLDLRFILEAPLRSGRSGGIGPIIVSTMIVTGIALAVAVPVGCGIALLLAELLPFTSRIGRVLRLALAMLAAVPSIVFGLVGNALFCEWLGLGFSLLSGGLTLACMVMPIIAFVVEQSLRGLPSTLRASAHALGIPLYKIVLRIVLPAVAPGIIGGIALGFGRAVAESAALVFTSGHVDRMPGSLLDSGRTLAVHILDLSMNVPGGESRAATTSLVLLIAMVLVLGGLGLVRITLARKLGAIQ
jgi:phosphate transport system permease protein